MPTEPNNSTGEYLSTVGELNPLLVFEQFDARPVILVIAAIWARNTQTGLLEERGAWLRRFWRATLEQIPSAHGTRLLWHTVFFAIPTTDAASVTAQFKQLLKLMYEPALESYCLINTARGSATEKLLILDEMQSGISSDRNFGAVQGFMVKLLDGDELLSKPETGI